jgi:recombinational DNA repair protein RecR
MSDYIESLTVLAEQFGRLSGVGRKSAMRMAFSVIELSDEAAEAFAKVLGETFGK